MVMFCPVITGPLDHGGDPPPNHGAGRHRSGLYTEREFGTRPAPRFGEMELPEGGGHWEVLDAAHEVGLGPLGLAGEFDRLYRGEQLRQDRAQLAPGEGGPETEMLAATEGDHPVGVGASH